MGSPYKGQHHCLQVKVPVQAETEQQCHSKDCSPTSMMRMPTMNVDMASVSREVPNASLGS